MPVVAERDVTELQLRGHAHLIASQTTTHITALTASAAPSLEMTGMRRIDQGAACADAATPLHDGAGGRGRGHDRGWGKQGDPSKNVIL